LREGELNDHLQLQTIVSVAPDGKTAKARGVELIMSSASAGRNAELSEGIFENEYLKQDGVWKIQSLHFYPRMITDSGQGWAKSAKSAPGPSREFPPDRPPTSTYEIYPGFSIVPFHFAHPVTGRSAQYPSRVAAASDSVSPGVPQGASTVRSAAELEANLAQAERNIAMSRTRDAAENLVSAGGYYRDESLWDDVANLFATGGRAEVPDAGIYLGRERIRKALRIRYDTGAAERPLRVDQIFQPVIHVAPDGKSAKIRSRLLELGGTSGGDGFWTAGVYEDELVNEEGVWRFKTMNLGYTWSAPYRGGWARAAGQAFPDVRNVPFHYKNPVTGRTATLPSQ